MTLAVGQAAVRYRCSTAGHACDAVDRPWPAVIEAPTVAMAIVSEHSVNLREHPFSRSSRLPLSSSSVTRDHPLVPASCGMGLWQAVPWSLLPAIVTEMSVL